MKISHHKFTHHTVLEVIVVLIICGSRMQNQNLEISNLDGCEILEKYFEKEYSSIFLLTSGQICLREC